MVAHTTRFGTSAFGILYEQGMLVGHHGLGHGHHPLPASLNPACDQGSGAGCRRRHHTAQAA